MQFKDFLYLDVNHITSIVSQCYGGRLVSVVDSTEHGTEQTTSESEQDNSGTKLQVSVPTLFDLGYSQSGASGHGEDVTERGAVSQVWTKTMDDNVFDIFLNAIDLSDEVPEKTPSYVFVKDKYSFADIPHLKNICSQEMTTAIKEAARRSVNREQRRAAGKSDNNSTDPFKELRNMLPAIEKLGACHSYMKTHNLLLSLNDNYKRVDYTEFALRQDSEVCILAQTIKKHALPNEGVDTLINSFEYILPSILPTLGISIDSNTYYSKPIAIYYEWG